ncbi:S1C family serine protease [Phenylobacterium sp.]|uniref:S1C family serine protease n=1 Tax=Phenylobacterium sp. TaxID=1871053 RepID=UPI00271F32B1|nr:serine protease [Phenylobacterium sp.]MDO8378090.1 serine protease [Phenylobacterium sp.]
MKFRIAIAAFVMALATAGSSLAQAWTPVTGDSDKNSFELDLGSIVQSGGYTQSMVRQVLAKPQKVAGTNKRYSTTVMQRLDDCRTRTFSLTAFTYFDDKGKVVQLTTLSPQEYRFVAPPPGSIAHDLQDRICTESARRAGLKASLEVGPTDKANWIPITYDARTNTRFSVREDSVISLGDNQVVVIVRADNGAPVKLADGVMVATGLIAEVFNCGSRELITMSADSYDSSGALVSVFQPPKEKLEPQTYAAGSVSELVAKYVCDESHIVATEDEGGTFVGTGWLGPKGYIITANHVIEGATLLELTRDGKVVGRAELVVADPANDIAILRPLKPLPTRTAIAFSAAPARLGERVFTLGYPAPDMLGTTLKMTSGEVSAMAGNDAATGRRDDARFLQVSMPIHSGNSGGPVIDDQGRAVGIVISKMTKAGEDEIAQNVNYALKIGYVRNLLSELPAVGAPVAATPRATISGLVEELQGSVFLVIASSGEAAERAR